MPSEPKRPRKLLIHRREVSKFADKAHEKGLTLVPLKMYFKRGRAKVLMGICRGKKTYDKRESLKKKDMQRDIEDPYAFFYRDTYYMIVEDRMDVASLLSGNLSPNPRPGGNRPGSGRGARLRRGARPGDGALLHVPRGGTGLGRDGHRQRRLVYRRQRR